MCFNRLGIFFYAPSRTRILCPKQNEIKRTKCEWLLNRETVSYLQYFYRMLQKAFHKKHIDIDCMDSLGRGALTMAIDNENLEMVELLVVMGVATKDSLLHAINVEFVEAVDLLLQHEEIIHKDGEPHVSKMSYKHRNNGVIWLQSQYRHSSSIKK
jgi:hypothetical protein